MVISVVLASSGLPTNRLNNSRPRTSRRPRPHQQISAKYVCLAEHIAPCLVKTLTSQTRHQDEEIGRSQRNTNSLHRAQPLLFIHRRLAEQTLMSRKAQRSSASYFSPKPNQSDHISDSQVCCRHLVACSASSLHKCVSGVTPINTSGRTITTGIWLLFQRNPRKHQLHALLFLDSGLQVDPQVGPQAGPQVGTSIDRSVKHSTNQGIGSTLRTGCQLKDKGFQFLILYNLISSHKCA